MATSLITILASCLLGNVPVQNICLSSLTSLNSDLSNDHITAICGDTYGFMWIGTASGLNRYDAHNVQVFRYEDLGLNTDYVRCIFEDSSGDIWIGTDSGITKYDRKHDIFVPLLISSDYGCNISKRISCIGEDNEGHIWISVGDLGMFSYCKKTEKLRQYYYRDGRMLVERGINSFSFDNNGGILISFYHGDLYYFRTQDFYDGSYMDKVPLSECFRNDNITSVCHIGSRNFAVASLNLGLCIVNTLSGECKCLIANDGQRFIPTRVIYRENNLIMSTNDGLYIYNLIDGDSVHIRTDHDNIHSLRSNDINYVEYSASHGLWLGLCGTGGINFFIPDNTKFEKISYTNGKNSLKGVNVTDFSFDKERNVLYVSTSYSGILQYSLNNKNASRLIPMRKSVESIFYDDNVIWIGTVGGLYKYYLSDGKIFKEGSFSNISRIGTTLDKKTIIIGTTLGMYFYDKDSGHFSDILDLKNYSITSFADDGKGSLWVTTMNDGVLKLDIASHKVTAHYMFEHDNPNSIPNNKCSCVNIDGDGDVWISTVGSGFCRIANGRIMRFNLKSHPELPSNCFYGILNDRNNNYWAKTDKGLVKCDFVSDKFYTFDQNSGLLDNNLTNYAQWMSLDGDIFLGSSDGFLFFNPDHFTHSRVTDSMFSRPLFTNLYVGSIQSGKVLAQSEDSPISVSIELTDRLELKPWENSFSLTVSTWRLSNLYTPVKYFLDGYETEASVLPNNGVISYSNLAPKVYTLYVDGHKPLVISIRQYWYLSSWAFLVYCLILISLSAIVVRYFYLLSAKRTRRKQEEQLFDEKLSFFSNVIHEIKTPIMLIKSPLKHLVEAESFPCEFSEDLDVISHNADYLSRLVSELLDYIRNEKNRYSISLTILELNPILEKLRFEFTKVALDNGIIMTFHIPENDMKVWADEAALFKILNNLLHNAIKYANSVINVNVSKSCLTDETVKIVLSNDGELIPQDKREEIFKPFVQYWGNNDTLPTRKGVGIGLAFARSLANKLGGSLILAEDNTMTSFVLTLKLATMNESDTEHEMNIQEDKDEVSISEDVILVVEDNCDLCEYMHKKLSGTYSVVTAHDVGHAMEILRRRRISIVISDIVLPGVSGIEFCGRINSSFEYSHIPVILMSSFSSDDMKIKAVQSGAILYLEKPFDMDYLKVNIEAILNKSFVDGGSSRELSQKLKLISQNDRMFIDRIDKWIRENLSDASLDNEAMAKELNVSIPTLHRKLKSLTGLTPNRYIRRYRLDMAAKMLSMGKCRINEVSYNVGFNSPSYFARCFREQFGCLPQEYMNDITYHS